MPIIKEILENTYKLAVQVLDTTDIASVTNLSEQQLIRLQNFIAAPERRKGVLTVLITSLAKKMLTPTQDIRQHQENLPGGYSGRTLDTAFVTPFLRDKGFPHMAESGWLTRSLEQNHAYDMQYPGKITPVTLKEAFLNILDDVEKQPDIAQVYLTYIFTKLEHFRRVQQASPILRLTEDVIKQLTVSTILEYLHEHFSQRYDAGISGAARLPVLALYSAYQCLMEEIGRYSNKQLYPLESHTASDSKSGKLGDIEVAQVADGELTAFEAVEVKYNRPITLDMVKTAYEKIITSSVTRYYILSTAEVKAAELPEISQFVTKIRSEHGCEIIVNGVEPTLKYYLRLVTNTGKFLERYAENLETDTAIKTEHRAAWNNIIGQKKSE